MLELQVREFGKAMKQGRQGNQTGQGARVVSLYGETLAGASSGGGGWVAPQAVEQVRGYWQALYGACGAVPYRSEIDPRGIEAALEYAFVLERIAPGVGRIRLAGMHLADLMGSEVGGMPLSVFMLPEARGALARQIDACCDAPAIADLRLVSHGAMLRPRLDARMLLLPLRSQDGEVNRILGVLAAQGDIGRKPRRFIVTATNLQPLGDCPQVSAPVPAFRGDGPLRPSLRLIESETGGR
jgi:hypothetical protein